MKKLLAAILLISTLLFSAFPASAQSGSSLAPMSIDQFMDYLNQTYAKVETPMGIEELSFDYIENTSSYCGYDYWLQTDWGKIFPSDIETSILYSDEEKFETIRILGDVQKMVARDVSVCLPGKKVEGGYYTGYYKYPNTKVGYESIKFLSWKNYGDSSPYGFGSYEETYVDVFRWSPEIDDYDFTAGLSDSLDDIVPPVLLTRNAVECDTTRPFTVEQGKTYQFKLTAEQLPTFVAGSSCFTVQYVGRNINDYYFKVTAVGAVGQSSGFYINGAPTAVTVATIV